MLTYIYLKSENSKVLSIMLILNKIRFRDVLLMAMLALTWLGYISLCSYHIV